MKGNHQPLKIAFDGSRAFVNNRTGTENYSYQLLLHLSLIDKENNYLVYLRPGSKVDSTNFSDNFKFIMINRSKLWTQAGLSVQLFKDRPDLLFVSAHTLPLIRPPWLKTIMTIHDLGSEYLPSMHQLKQRLYLSFITRLQLKGATKLIAVSKATKQDLISKVKIKSSNIEVIYEGINEQMLTKLSQSELESTLKEFKLQKNNYFIFVGTIQPRKNLVRLIEAFSKLETTHKLVLVGSKGWLSDQIYELPMKLKITDQVHFLGRVNDANLKSLLSGATALVFPSLFEGFGLPILEAFATNCPVITSKISSMPEVAGKAAILVDPYKIDEITQAMRFVLKEGVRKKLIEDGREQLTNFSWTKAAQETLQLIKEVSYGQH